MAKDSDLPKMLHIVVHGEEDSVYRLVGSRASMAVENYSPRTTHVLISRLALDRDIDYSSLEGFLGSVSHYFKRNGVPFSWSLKGSSVTFKFGCPIAAAVHPAVPIRKCLLAKYFAALAFRFSEGKGIGVPVLQDSRFTAKGSTNRLSFLMHVAAAGKAVRKKTAPRH